MDEKIEDLVLLVLDLTSWEEDAVTESGKVRRSWKGYPFDVLNSLEENGLITQSRRSKSVCLTDEGIKYVEQIKKKFKIKV